MRSPSRSRSWSRLLAACACFATVLPSAQAALTISSTRIVQHSDRHSTSVIIANPSKRPYAAQIWVNTETDDTTTTVPLIASPALARLDPDSEQTVQINRLPNDLPQDRETLFYFNVQEIPQAQDNAPNTLTIALRTRIKLFYRPSQLQGRPDDHFKAVEWSLQTIDGKPHLVVDNPTPYYYTFGTLEFSQGGQTETLEARAMAIPKNRQSYPLKHVATASTAQVTFNIVNDYGAVSETVTRKLPRR
ncbi:chaperone protein EcpD [Pseudomonas hunanensis]|uniref:Chaperone protein EcpD n=1 Tax=Pseudomonas hunanensis TaxID=1247546 RepID=A0ACC6K884_9PSED|nr:molecular chaperone [Pseudomonas hunanensis]MDR6714636.1 chaperone protein EcpD [Pseudomonas hunanensis]